jgi:hypothetical protein
VSRNRDSAASVPALQISPASITGGGTGVVSHAGLVLVRRLADRTGLTAPLTSAL